MSVLEHNVSIVACTFRPFSGTSNDYIQDEFLKSIKAQTVPVRLIVTEWGEVGVCEKLRNSGIPFELIQGTGDKFSHSQVFSNAYQKFPTLDIIWTTADVYFAPNFFEEITSALQKKNYAVSWPHYKRQDEILTTLPRLTPELDLVGISKRITNQVSSRVNQYRNIGWGAFENQLIAFAQEAQGNPKFGSNISLNSKMWKTENPREQLNISTEKLRQESLENIKRWQGWLINRKRKKFISMNFLLLQFSNIPFKIRLSLIRSYTLEYLRKFKYFIQKRSS